MPDVFPFLKAFLLSASASTFVVLAFAVYGVKRSSQTTTGGISPNAILCGAVAGICAGYWGLQVSWKWPPINALDRFREVILPVTVIVELLACRKCMSRPIICTLRGAVALTLGIVLLHGSVYLPRDSVTPIEGQTISILLFTLLSLLVVWLLLFRLTMKPAAASIGVALAMCIQCSGAVIMLAGYINGGAAAIPLAGAILATSATSWFVCKTADLRGLISVAVVSLFSLLFIGRFFGAISTTQALAIFLSPLLCCVTELPMFQHRNPRQIAMIRIGLVSLPLLIILILSTLEFDQRMAPLISRGDNESHARPHPRFGTTSGTPMTEICIVVHGSAED